MALRRAELGQGGVMKCKMEEAMEHRESGRRMKMLVLLHCMRRWWWRSVGWIQIRYMQRRRRRDGVYSPGLIVSVHLTGAQQSWTGSFFQSFQASSRAPVLPGDRPKFITALGPGRNLLGEQGPGVLHLCEAIACEMPSRSGRASYRSVQQLSFHRAGDVVSQHRHPCGVGNGD